MKRCLACLLAIALLLMSAPLSVFAASATSGTCGDNLTWILDGDTLTISGEGEMYDCEDAATPWHDLEFSRVIVESGVTSIGEWAFSWREDLTSITVPDSVTSIGEAAFSGTGYDADETNWENGVLYIGYHLIRAKSEITGDYTVKRGTKTIADGAFSWCIGLTSVTVPDSVTHIGNDAFTCCTSLTSTTIGNSVVYIGDSAFAHCTNLTDITIPDSVNSMGKYAFYNCTGLTNMTIRDGVTRIGDGAFGRCSSLSNITIPDSVISIGNEAFADCTHLTDIIIGNGVNDIGDGIFFYCTSLTSITIPKSVGVADIDRFNFYDLDNLTIYGYIGSDAESYADANNILFVPIGNVYTPGNVDGEGKVTAVDALVTLKAAIGQVTLSSGQTTAADVNHDSKVDIIDALIILQYAAGKIDHFPSAE